MRHLVILSFVVAAAAACSSNKPPSQQHNDAGIVDSSPIDSNVGPTVDASCFTNPTTHLEIINACTTATAIYKDSHPPLTLPDGGLPPLPQN
jgi:hypothetical protein|nr:hypothetical protein [Kofleriaceae bacterium]